MNSKIKKTTTWVLIGILTLQFAAAGLSKYTGSWDTRFLAWGFPIIFTYIIGAVEVIGTIGLYNQKTRKWSILVLSLLMIGAMITHLLNDETTRLVHNGLVILALIILNQLTRKIN